MQSRTVVLSLFAVVILISCATTKTVTEIEPFQGDFSKYQVVAVELVPNAKIDKELHPETFPEFLRKALVQQKAFRKVVTSKQGADLVMKVEITSLDSPGAMSTMFMGGVANAEAKVKCQFVDAKGNRPLATLETTGNSKNMPRSAVGGIGITGGQTHTNRAFQNAAEAIVDYITKHHSGMVASNKQT